MKRYPRIFFFWAICLSAHSQSFESSIEEANVQFENLQFEAAASSYSNIYKATGNPEALFGMTRAKFELGLQFQFNGGDEESKELLAEALSQAIQLTSINNTHDEYRLLRGRMYLYNGHLEQARQDFEYVQQLFPGNGRAYYYLWTLEPAQGLEKVKHAYVEKALSLNPDLYELYQELGAYYNSLGMVNEAVISYEKALDISPKNYKAHFALGQVYWNAGDLEKMRYHFEKSLEFFPDFGYAQMMLAGVELMTGHTTEAVKLIKKALKNNPQAEAYLPMYKENFPELNNYNFRAKGSDQEGPLDANGYPRYYAEAVTKAQNHDYYGALYLFHQCYDAYLDYEHSQAQWTMSILAWLSHCNLELGNYAGAIHASEDALELAVENDITTDQASLTATIGMIYYRWGDLIKAIDYTKTSVDYLHEYGQDEFLYDAYINLGSYYRKSNQHDSSVYYNEKALEAAANGSAQQKAIAHKELALSYSASGKMAKAKSSVGYMLEEGGKMKVEDQMAALNLGAAQVYYKLGEYKEAQKYLLAAENHYLEFQKNVPYHASLIDFAWTSTGIMANLNQAEATYNNLKYINNNLVYQIETNFPVMNEQGKMLFYREASESFERFNSYAFTHTNAPQEVLRQLYENQLLKKGLLFNDAARFHRMMSKSDNPEVSNLNDQLIVRKNLMARSVTLSAAERTVRNINLKKIQTEIDSIQTSLGRISATKQRMKIYEENLVDKVQQQLAPNEAAVEIIRFRKFDFSYGGRFTDQVHYVALIIKGGTQQIEFVLLDNGSFIETKGYEAYSNSIEYEVDDNSSYGHYWEPIQQRLKGIDKIYFAGDGVYHKINLNTLYNPATKKYLIDELDIRLVTSTRDILLKSPNMPRKGNVCLIGFPSFELDTETDTEKKQTLVETRAFASMEYLAPLPGTYSEVKSIEKLFSKTNWVTTVLTGPEAKEENIKGISNPTVLHIATHGYFQQSDEGLNPLLYSGLFLSGATSNFKNKSYTGEDGVLTAYEAMNLDLHDTQMVVLSACETGMGRIENGEGVYGLQRAFLIAGSGSVVMSMWKVNDQTTMELMSDFYAQLNDSKNKHLAFRQAQQMLKQKYPEPKYWGAFNIIGK